MNIIDVLKALFMMPAQRQKFKVRCVAHGAVFEELMDMSFHETMNLGCRWERLDAEPRAAGAEPAQSA